jgi:hypothetical protein
MEPTARRDKSEARLRDVDRVRLKKALEVISTRTLARPSPARRKKG